MFVYRMDTYRWKAHSRALLYQMSLGNYCKSCQNVHFHTQTHIGCLVVVVLLALLNSPLLPVFSVEHQPCIQRSFLSLSGDWPLCFSRYYELAVFHHKMVPCKNYIFHNTNFLFFVSLCLKCSLTVSQCSLLNIFDPVTQGNTTSNSIMTVFSPIVRH